MIHDLFFVDLALTRFKSFEIQLYNCWSVWGLGVELQRNTSGFDHWGWTLDLKILSLCLHLQIYDVRHADD